jgi:hypothetical protein
VGVIDIERQGGGLEGGSTLNQLETRSNVIVFLLALKTAINLEIFWRNKCSTAVDGIMQTIQ